MLHRTHEEQLTRLKDSYHHKLQSMRNAHERQLCEERERLVPPQSISFVLNPLTFLTSILENLTDYCRSANHFEVIAGDRNADHSFIQDKDSKERLIAAHSVWKKKLHHSSNQRCRKEVDKSPSNAVTSSQESSHASLSECSINGEISEALKDPPVELLSARMTISRPSTPSGKCFATINLSVDMP